MNYVDSLKIGGVDAFQLPCIKIKGAPTTETIGAVGLLGFDIDTGKVYKCTAAADGVYTWEISDSPIKYIDGANALPPLALLEMDPGTYVLNGSFLPSRNSDAQIEFFNRLVRIDPIDEGEIVVSYQDADGLTCIYITNDGYERKWYCLADLGGGTVKTVNGIAPDENGDVKVETGIDEIQVESDSEIDLFPAGTVQNWVMGYGSGKITFYESETYYSVFIPVEAGKTYRITSNVERPAYVDLRHAFFDVQDVNLIVANQSYTNATYNKENLYIDTPISFTAPSNGYYGISAANINRWDVQFLSEHETVPTAEYRLSGDVKLVQEHINQVKNAISTSNVSGKKLGVIGDSITVGYMVTGYNEDGSAKGGYVTKKWYDYVAERYGFASVQANAEIGRAFTKSGSMSTRFTQKIKELDSDLDVIIVFGGTNDFNWSPTIGTMDDTPSEEDGGISFFAALRFTAEYLQTNFPNARIVFMTPLPRKNSEGFNGKDTNGKRVIDYADAIAEMCRCYGFDIVDLNRVGGFYVWSDTWLNAYMMDGLHPNEAGTEVYVRNGILPKLDTLFFDK